MGPGRGAVSSGVRGTEFFGPSAERRVFGLKCIEVAVAGLAVARDFCGHCYGLDTPR
jgi:hypothetical protein